MNDFSRRHFIPASDLWHALSSNEYLHLTSSRLSSPYSQGPPTLNYQTFIQQRDSSTVLEIAEEYRRRYRIGTELELLPRQLR